jgi:hypothetical protein
MKDFWPYLGKALLTLCISIFAIFGLALIILRSAYSIQNMKVFVTTPTNAPPWVTAVAATNHLIPTDNWVIDVPYTQATNKLVSEIDIAEMKEVIPWHKTVLRLYRPSYIVVESPTEAYAEFSRFHMVLRARLIKKNNKWNIDEIRSSKWELARPLTSRERAAEALPF